MTIYIDNAGIPATVQDPDSGRRHRSRWCHLFSDQIDPTELHAFAQRLGLKRAWFQPGRRYDGGGHDPARDHYDLTASKRRQAITAGAIAVDTHQAVGLWVLKRRAGRDQSEHPGGHRELRS